MIEVLTRAGANRSGVSDKDANSASINRVKVGNVAASEGPVGEVGVRPQDFWDFLPKLELTS